MTDTANPARLTVAATFQSAQPDWNVIAEARTPDGVLKDTVVVWTEKLARTAYKGGEFVVSTVEVWLLPIAEPKNLEDRADKLLTAALEVIEANPELSWSEATRGSLDGAWHGWHIILTVAHQLTKE